MDEAVEKMTQNTRAKRLILASQSAVRAALLRNAGLRFETLPAHVDEAALLAKNAEKTPSEIALCLAEAKARAVTSRQQDSLVIGADQLLVFDGAILQKPQSRQEAAARLELLSGRSHQLVTASVLAFGAEIVWRHVEIGELGMHELSWNEIARHMAEEEDFVLQSVGGYRLEGPGIRLFASLEGDHFAMLGLPLVPLIAALRRLAPRLLPGFEAS